MACVKNELEIDDYEHQNSFIKAAKIASGQVVEGKHRSYIFQCESEQDLLDWMSCIQDNIFKSPIFTLQQLKKFKMLQPQ